MSKSLHDKYLKNNNVNIIKLVFRIEGLPDFIHYFSSDDNINDLINVSNEAEFEAVFSGFSGDPGACEKCFQEYLNSFNGNEKMIMVQIGNGTK